MKGHSMKQEIYFPNNFGSKHSLVMKFGQKNVLQKKFSKNSTKSKDGKLVPVPFTFIKN